jgi:hypothetical protein
MGLERGHRFEARFDDGDAKRRVAVIGVRT